MSNSDVSETIKLYDSLLRGGLFFTASYALILYDYFTTLDQEATLFWNRKLNGATILFFSNRYFYLLYSIYGACTSIPMPDQSCVAAARSQIALKLFPYFPWAAFNAMRAFALTTNWYVGGAVLLLSITTPVLDLSEYHFNVTGVNVPKLGCELDISLNPALSRIYTIVSRTCLMAADVILILVTWKTLRRRYGPGVALERRSFSYVLLWDGTLYFVILLILNALHITLTLLSYHPGFSGVSYVTAFTSPLTSILVSRFLLNLQAADRDRRGFDDSLTNPAAAESIRFERVVGSLASSLSPKDLGMSWESEEDTMDEERGDALHPELASSADVPLHPLVH